jgi:hypothetical protein
VINAAATIATLTILPRVLRWTGVSFSGMASLPIQLKNNSQIEKVKNAAKQGYIRISGESSCSNFVRTNTTRTPTASSMPRTPQRIQAGKNDPRMLKEGAREHPVADSIAAVHAPMAAIRNLPRPVEAFNLVFVSRGLRIQ